VQRSSYIICFLRMDRRAHKKCQTTGRQF
jgi:hypothetical protein